MMQIKSHEFSSWYMAHYTILFKYGKRTCTSKCLVRFYFLCHFSFLYFAGLFNNCLVGGYLASHIEQAKWII